MNHDSNQELPDRKELREPSQTDAPPSDCSLSDLISMNDDQDVRFEPERLGLRARVVDI